MLGSKTKKLGRILDTIIALLNTFRPPFTTDQDLPDEGANPAAAGYVDGIHEGFWLGAKHQDAFQPVEL